MKIFSTLFVLLLLHQHGAAQAPELYVRFRTAGAVTKTALNAKENLLPFAPSLQNLRQQFRLASLRSSFYFSKADGLRRTYRLQVPMNVDARQLAKRLALLPEVEYAEAVPQNRLRWEANDIGVNTTTGQWGLHTIRAEAAWDIHRGNTSVVVAVVDNGVQLAHPDLQNKLTAGRDVSDDDDNPGIPNNTFSHGTHVAGIVGAETNNGVGVASIGNRIRVMPIKAEGNAGDPDKISDGYEGILWAAENGADIINCSWGGRAQSLTAQAVITTATLTHGALVVAAAGNDNTDTLYYPAAYTHVLSVASTTNADIKSGFSNFGQWIDICAPGSSIRSTLPGGTYGALNGTSMAAPMVAGVCGLIKSCSANYTPAQITDFVKNTADPVVYVNDPGFNGVLGTGRLDAYAALAAASLCRSNETISGNFTRALTESSNWIQTSGTTTVAAGEQVILDATTEVVLTPGFSAAPGTVFRAGIEGCGGGPPNGITRMAGPPGSGTQIEKKILKRLRKR